MDVEIAEVQIIDPFAQANTPLVELLRTRLATTEQEAAREKVERHRLERENAMLRAQIVEERAQVLASRRRGFEELVRALRSFAPFAPITEEVLRMVNASLYDVETLNEAFGVQHSSVQEHINSLLSQGGDE